MNRKKVVETYQNLILYLPKLGRKGHGKLVDRILEESVQTLRDSIVPILNQFLNDSDKYPELRDTSYLPPAGYTAMFVTAERDPKKFYDFALAVAKRSNVNDPSLVSVTLGHHCIPVMVGRYLKHHQVMKYAVSNDVMAKAKLLGDPLDIPILELIDRIDHPQMYVCEDGNVYMVYKTPYYKESLKTVVDVLRIERLGGILGSSFFDIYPVNPEMKTLRELYDYYRTERLEMVLESKPTEAMDETAEIIPLLMLTLSNNVTVPTPSEFNDQIIELKKSGHHGRAKRHESFRFINMEETVFSSSGKQKTFTGSGTGSSKAAHTRCGHFRRQRIGSRSNWTYKTIWISPTVVGGHAEGQNKVFRVIQL